MLSSKCIPCALRNGSCTEVSRAMLGFFLSLLMDSCGPTRLPSMPMLWPMDRQASVKSIETRTDSAAYHRLPSGAQRDWFHPITTFTAFCQSHLGITFGKHSRLPHSHHHDPVLRSRSLSWQVGSWIKELNQCCGAPFGKRLESRVEPASIVGNRRKCVPHNVHNAWYPKK